MTSHRVVLFGFLLVVASSAALPATQLEATAKLSAPESILAEPVTLEACLSAALIEEKAVLVSSEMLLSLRMNGPLGPCKKARNIQGYEENPGSLWMLPITLTKESSRWCKQIRLDREFVLQGSGDYTVTIEWLSRAVDAKAKAKALPRLGAIFQARPPSSRRTSLF